MVSSHVLVSLATSFVYVFPIWAVLLCRQVFLGSRSCSWVLPMKCATGRRDVYSVQIMLQQLFHCIGPSVSCWLPKCHRQPCFCLSLCPLPCPVLFSEVRWLLMAPSRQRSHSVTAPRGRARRLGQPGVGGWNRERIRRAGFGEKGGLKQPPLPVPLHSCHTCVTTTSLCLFELSLPISANKSLCKDEQAWCSQSAHIQARINRSVHNKQTHTPPNWGPHKNPRSTTSQIGRENPKCIFSPRKRVPIKRQING